MDYPSWDSSGDLLFIQNKQTKKKNKHICPHIYFCPEASMSIILKVQQIDANTDGASDRESYTFTKLTQCSGTCYPEGRFLFPRDAEQCQTYATKLRSSEKPSVSVVTSHLQKRNLFSWMTDPCESQGCSHS